MSTLFKTPTRILINLQEATVYPAGADDVSVIFDQGPPKIYPRLTLIKAHKDRQVVIQDDYQTIVPLDGLGQVSAKTVRKLAYLNVLRSKKFSRSRNTISAVIRQVSSSNPSEKPPSVSTVYGWLRVCESAGESVDPQHVLEPLKRKCDSRISTEVNTLMVEVIDAYYMQPTIPSVMFVYTIFIKEYQRLFPDNKIRSPHKSTFYNRIEALCPFNVEFERKGRSAAKLLRRTALHQMRADQILETVQLDAVHLNIPLFDEEGNSLGSPVVHIAIDVFSRAVMGFSIELNSESSAGVVECIKHAVSMKYKDDHYYTKNEWEMYGKPLEVITDGGPAYISESVTGFLSVLGITRIVNESYTPWHKAIVERFNLTLRLRFASLFTSYVGRKKDGRDLHTLKKYGQKVTLKQFKKALTCYIVDDYNQSPHNSLLKRTPTNSWLDSAIYATPLVPCQLEMAMKLNGKLLSATLNSVQGIRVNNVFYNSRKMQNAFLEELGREVFNGAKVNFLYNPMKIDSITLVINKEIIQVPVSRSDYPVLEGMSLTEHRVQRKKRIDSALAENDLQQRHVGFQDRIDEMLEQRPLENVANRSKKRSHEMPIEKVNAKMAFMGSGSGAETEEADELYEEASDSSAAAYFAELTAGFTIEGED
jgi:transposase InsO family protein